MDFTGRIPLEEEEEWRPKNVKVGVQPRTFGQEGDETKLTLARSAPGWQKV